MLKESPIHTEDFNQESDESPLTFSSKKRRPSNGAMVSGVGTAFPSRSYTQLEVASLLGIHHPTVEKLLKATHIKKRHLYLPDPLVQGNPIHDETHEELINKFNFGVRDIGCRAASQAIMASPFAKSEIEFLICVTSSGFAVPGVSSIIARELNLRSDLYRLDVVGMGCNAGMSALRTAAALAKTGKVGLMLCCEVNSAIYVRDESVRTGIVNSLFGDGAVAIIISDKKSLRKNGNPAKNPISEIIDFESHTLPEQWDAMRFDWNVEKKKWSFGLSKQIPFVVGQNLKIPIDKLLRRNSIHQKDIRHWTLHTGGAAVIEGAKTSLGLNDSDVKHTRSVLKYYGNISSGSFLVSLSRLFDEKVIRHRELGVWAAMGPGATLEACVVQYEL